MTHPHLPQLYPWIRLPLIISAPVRPFATSSLASAVSLAGGFGFLSFIPDSDPYSLTPTGTSHDLVACQTLLKGLPRPADAPDVLPIGIGYLIHSAPFDVATQQIRTHKPAVVWLFAPTDKPAANPTGTLRAWADMVRKESGNQSAVWVQVGSVAGALHAIDECGSEISIVVQGTDAGGHGLLAGAGLIPLLPEIGDTLREEGYGGVSDRLIAAGGIADARGAAAAFALGASSVVLGTRFLASEEVSAPEGFTDSVIAASDGGQSTFRTNVFDQLRGTKLGGEEGNGWPVTYGGRGVRNVSSGEILEQGVPFEEVKKKFDAAQASGRRDRFGADGRDVTYAGTGVGLVKKVLPAKTIVEEIRKGVNEILENASTRAHGNSKR